MTWGNCVFVTWVLPRWKCCRDYKDISHRWTRKLPVYNSRRNVSEESSWPSRWHLLMLIKLFGKRRVWPGLDAPDIMLCVMGSYNNPPQLPGTKHT